MKMKQVETNTVQKARRATCSGCGEKFKKSELKKTIENYLMCPDCIKEDYFTCECCNKIVENENKTKTPDNKNYCTNCFNDNYFECQECDEVLPINVRRLTPGDDELCRSCFEANYFLCHHCNEIMNRRYRYASPDGDYICEGCYEDIVSTCGGCSREVWSDDIIYDEEEDRYSCTRCNRGRVINSYNYIPSKFNFNKLKYEEGLFMGIELEVEHRNFADMAVDLEKFLETLEVSDKFYLKGDGSLHGGFEIVSRPFTLKYANKYLKFYQILKWLKEKKFTSYENARCGLHVHVDKSLLDIKEINKLRLFFDENEPYINEFSNRQGKGMTYCRYNSFNKVDYKKGEKYSEGRFNALNLNSHQSTIEIRCFRGTLNYNRFISTLQFCDAVSHFVKDISFMSINWESFMKWLHERNRYNHLEQFLIKKVNTDKIKDIIKKKEEERRKAEIEARKKAERDRLMTETFNGWTIQC